MSWFLGPFMGCWLLPPLVIPEVLWSVRLMASLFLKPGINHCPPPPCLDGACSWGCWKLQDAGQLGVLGRESWEGERCPSRLPNTCSALLWPPLCSCQTVWVELTLFPAQGWALISLNQSTLSHPLFHGDFLSSRGGYAGVS